MKAKRIAAALSFALVMIPLVSFMPWSGSSAKEISEAIPPYIEETNKPSPTPTEAAKAITPEPTVTELPEEEQYTPDAAEVEALARMLYGEARGIASDMEKAACVWCVLNRVDDPCFPDTVLEVLEAPYQFAGYSADYPVLPELAALAADVLTRYHAERDGDTDAGRVLPAEYVYFTGDGRRNYFTAEWKSDDAFQWTLTNPYDD